MAPCTYGDALDLVTRFVRDQGIRDHFPGNGGMVGDLFHAMRNRLGDFADNEIVGQVLSKIDAENVRDDITSVFVAVNTIQAMPNRVLFHPHDAMGA